MSLYTTCKASLQVDYRLNLLYKTIRIKRTRIPMIPPVMKRCWYIRQIIFFSVPEARSMDESA